MKTTNSANNASPLAMKVEKARTYHHGNLSQTLIIAAKTILQTAGLEGLSMRKLAEETGVSRAAPYHHFKDKKTLLCAIAEDGFKQQDQLLNLLIDSRAIDESRQSFEAFVISYVHYAANNPEQYDLMYGGELWKSGVVTKSLDQAAKNSFKEWLHKITLLQARGILNQAVPPLRLAQVTWATLHGLCRLLNDGIYINAEDIDEMGRTAVSILLKTA